MNDSSYLFFLPVFALLQLGCSMEDFTNGRIEKNSDSPADQGDINQQVNEEDDKKLHALTSSLEKFSVEMQNTLVSKEKEGYDKIKSLIEDSLQKNQFEEKKFQFLCDENERWIYRCNLITGEIECFSMSSNKLRLLSSIK